jgi:hypothetical protein
MPKGPPLRPAEPPGSVAGGQHYGRDESRRRRLTIGSILEVGLSINHDNVSHTVFKGIPEWRICERGSLVGVDLRCLTGRRRCECTRHRGSKAVHEVGEVFLAFWAGKIENRYFLEIESISEYHS